MNDLYVVRTIEELNDETLVCSSLAHAVNYLWGMDGVTVGQMRELQHGQWYGALYDDDPDTPSFSDRVGVYYINRTKINDGLIRHIFYNEASVASPAFDLKEHVEVFIDIDRRHPEWVPGVVEAVETVLGRHCYIVRLDRLYGGLDETHVWRYAHEVRSIQDKFERHIFEKGALDYQCVSCHGFFSSVPKITDWSLAYVAPYQNTNGVYLCPQCNAPHCPKCSKEMGHVGCEG